MCAGMYLYIAGVLHLQIQILSCTLVAVVLRIVVAAAAAADLRSCR